MSRPTIKSLTAQLEEAHAKHAALEKSFVNMNNGYAEGVKRIAEQKQEIDRALRLMKQEAQRAVELERRLKKAEQAAARYADANAKALSLLDWMTANDRIGERRMLTPEEDMVGDRERPHRP